MKYLRFIFVGLVALPSASLASDLIEQMAASCALNNSNAGEIARCMNETVVPVMNSQVEQNRSSDAASAQVFEAAMRGLGAGSAKDESRTLLDVQEDCVTSVPDARLKTCAISGSGVTSRTLTEYNGRVAYVAGAFADAEGPHILVSLTARFYDRNGLAGEEPIAGQPLIGGFLFFPDAYSVKANTSVLLAPLAVTLTVEAHSSAGF